MTTTVWQAEELGTDKLKQTYVDSPITEYRAEKVVLHTQYEEGKHSIEAKYGKKFKKDDMVWIGEYMLANKDRSTGIPPLMAYLKDKYPYKTKDEIIKMVADIKAGKYMTDMHMEMVDLARDLFKKVADQIRPTYEKDQNLIFPEMTNYFPTAKDTQRGQNKMTKEQKDRNEASILENTTDSYAQGIKKGFTKEAK